MPFATANAFKGKIVSYQPACLNLCASRSELLNSVSLRSLVSGMVLEGAGDAHRHSLWHSADIPAVNDWLNSRIPCVPQLRISQPLSLCLAPFNVCLQRPDFQSIISVVFLNSKRPSLLLCIYFTKYENPGQIPPRENTTTSQFWAQYVDDCGEVLLPIHRESTHSFLFRRVSFLHTPWKFLAYFFSISTVIVNHYWSKFLETAKMMRIPALTNSVAIFRFSHEDGP